MIDGLALQERVRDDARAVYRLIAEAEGEAHGRPADRIHFHEVGTLDAVADIRRLLGIVTSRDYRESRMKIGRAHV